MFCQFLWFSASKSYLNIKKDLKEIFKALNKKFGKDFAIAFIPLNKIFKMVYYTLKSNIICLSSRYRKISCIIKLNYITKANSLFA